MNTKLVPAAVVAGAVITKCVAAVGTTVMGVLPVMLLADMSVAVIV